MERGEQANVCFGAMALMELSVVVRFHEGANISLLTRALYCLLDETVLGHEIIVMVQFTDDATLEAVQALCASLFRRIPYRVAGIQVPAGADRRGQLLAEGMALARGEYIAFLDYDDVLFMGATAQSIEACRSESSDMAIAQCYIAYIEGIFPHDYVVTKERFVTNVPNNPLHLVVTNFAPICACVVSREFLTRTGITVSQQALLLEDYELVLKVLAQGRITLRPLVQGVVAAQYNFNVDAGGTTLQLCLDDEAKEREEPRWQAERDRLWRAVLPKLRLELDLLTLRQLMSPTRETQPAVLNIREFVRRVHDERTKA